jgi:hypothetical protein
MKFAVPINRLKDAQAMPRPPTPARQRLESANAVRRSAARALAHGATAVPADFRQSLESFFRPDTLSVETEEKIRDAVLCLLQFYGINETTARNKPAKEFWSKHFDLMYWNLRNHIGRSKISHKNPERLNEFWRRIATDIQEKLQEIATALEVNVRRFGDPRSIAKDELTKS